jgi:hypothetical protein
VDNASLSGVIGSLQLWDVDDMTGHGRRSYESALCKAFQLLAVNGCAFLLLAAPMLTGSASAVECTVEICGYYFAVVVDLAIEGGTLGPWDSRIGDEDVEAAIELIDDLIYDFFYGLPAGNVDLVCLA